MNQSPDFLLSTNNTTAPIIVSCEQKENLTLTTLHSPSNLSLFSKLFYCSIHMSFQISYIYLKNRMCLDEKRGNAFNRTNINTRSTHGL